VRERESESKRERARESERERESESERERERERARESERESEPRDQREERRTHARTHTHASTGAQAPFASYAPDHAHDVRFEVGIRSGRRAALTVVVWPDRTRHVAQQARLVCTSSWNWKRLERGRTATGHPGVQNVQRRVDGAHGAVGPARAVRELGLV
jgi:hypothetical protein